MKSSRTLSGFLVDMYVSLDCHLTSFFISTLIVVTVPRVYFFLIVHFYGYVYVIVYSSGRFVSGLRNYSLVNKFFRCRFYLFKQVDLELHLFL